MRILPVEERRALVGLQSGRRHLDGLRIALTGVLLTYVWRIQDLLPGISSLKIPTLFTAVAMVFLFLDPRVRAQLRAASRHRLWRLMPWFVLCAALSAACSISLRWSATYFLAEFLPSVALAMIVPAGIFVVGDGHLFAAIQVIGASLYCAVILTTFDEGANGRLGKLVFYDANDLGMLLVCTLPLAFYFVRFASRIWWRVASVGAMLLFVLAIAETGSRGAFLGLLTVCAYMLVRFRTMRPAFRIAIVGGTGLLLVLGAGGRYWTAMSSILHPSGDYNWAGESGRMSIWRRGIGYVEDHPLTGVGIWAFPVAEGTISAMAERQEWGRGVKWSAAHNSFVQVAAELGIPGILLFVLILFTAFRCASRLARDALHADYRNRAQGELAQAHAAAITGYAVSGFFLSQAYAAYLYFVIGMVIGLDVTVRAQWRVRQARTEGLSGVRPLAWRWRGRPVRPPRHPALR